MKDAIIENSSAIKVFPRRPKQVYCSMTHFPLLSSSSPNPKSNPISPLSPPLILYAIHQSPPRLSFLPKLQSRLWKCFQESNYFERSQAVNIVWTDSSKARTSGEQDFVMSVPIQH